MAELTSSTREAARRLGVSDTTMHKAERTGRITREPDGQWDIAKTRARLLDTADPQRSALAGSAAAEGTPFARLKVAQLALKVEAQRLALDESKGRLLDVATANATIDEIASTMRDALLNWPARASGNTMLSRELMCGIEDDGEPSSVPPQQTMASIFSP
jgi:DNA-binding XRE family transcriptional regulator